MHLTYYGHSCFEVEVAGKRLLLDPFITPNPLAEKIDVSKIKPDYIFLSHGHFDHVADVETIARQSGAILVGSFEVMNWFQKKGLEKIFPMNVGGSYHFEFGCVTMTNAIHSSSMPDGSYGGQPGGFLIKTAEGSFYYSGDTGLTHDMKLIAAMGPLKFAVLCIGDCFTMGVQDAITAANWVGCKEVVGVHYDTFPPIKIDHAQVQAAFQKASCNLYLMPIGSTRSF
ncbi:MAG: metal-dependent hydrolase [Verrucomicrobia bacterium]|nr:metal-dependent hydrolase [Verrucomicrobiota bacterium]